MTESFVPETAAKPPLSPKPAPSAPTKTADGPEAAGKSEAAAKLVLPADGAKSTPALDTLPSPTPIPGRSFFSPGGHKKQATILASALFSLIAGIAGVRLMWPANDAANTGSAPSQALSSDAKSPPAETPGAPEPPSAPAPTRGDKNAPSGLPSSEDIVKTGNTGQLPLPVMPLNGNTNHPDRFKITDQTFVSMRSVNVPEAIITKIGRLKNHEFSREDLETELAKVLTVDEKTRYENTIVIYAKDSDNGLAIPSINVVPGGTSPPPLSPTKPTEQYTITDQTLTDLKNAKMDDVVLTQLKPLKNKSLSQEELEKQITLVVSRFTLTPDQKNQYLRAILYYAKPSEPPAYTHNSPVAANPQIGSIPGPLSAPVSSTPVAPLPAPSVFPESSFPPPQITAGIPAGPSPPVAAISPPQLGIPQAPVAPSLAPAVLTQPGYGQSTSTGVEVPKFPGRLASETSSSGSPNGSATIPAPAFTGLAAIPPPPSNPTAPPQPNFPQMPSAPVSQAAPTVAPRTTPDSFKPAGTNAVSSAPATSGTTPTGLPGLPPVSVPTMPAAHSAASMVTPAAFQMPQSPVAPQQPAPMMPTAPGMTLPATNSTLPAIPGSPAPMGTTTGATIPPPPAPSTLAPIPVPSPSPSPGAGPSLPPPGLPVPQPTTGLSGTPSPGTPGLPAPAGSASVAPVPSPSVFPEPLMGSPAAASKPPVVPVMPASDFGSRTSTDIGAANHSTKPSTSAPTAPVAAVERAPITSYDVDVYELKATDTWETISQEFYNDKRYAAALRAANSNKALSSGGMVDIPPLYILKQKFQNPATPRSTTSQTPPPASPPPTWAPSVATTPAVPNGGFKLYKVPPGGISMRAIARNTLGDDQRWGEIYNLNPQLRADLIPEGTDVRLPTDAKLPN
jgi:hypothetical protein